MRIHLSTPFYHARRIFSAPQLLDRHRYLNSALSHPGYPYGIAVVAFGTQAPLSVHPTELEFELNHFFSLPLSLFLFEERPRDALIFQRVLFQEWQAWIFVHSTFLSQSQPNNYSALLPVLFPVSRGR